MSGCACLIALNIRHVDLSVQEKPIIYKKPPWSDDQGGLNFKEMNCAYGQTPQPLSSIVRSAPLVVPSPVMSPSVLPQAESSVERSAPLR